MNESTSLWQAVLDFIDERGVVTRARVFERFSRDEPLQVASVLRDLVNSGTVFSTGQGEDVVYRGASADDMAQIRKLADSRGIGEFPWVVARLQQVGLPTSPNRTEVGGSTYSFDNDLR